jgi:hypothetical protein
MTQSAPQRTPNASPQNLKHLILKAFVSDSIFFSNFPEMA